MTFRVEITAGAEQDSDAVLEWLLSHDAGNAGLRWFVALQDAIASLREFPERCPFAPENSSSPFKVATYSTATPLTLSDPFHG